MHILRKIGLVVATSLLPIFLCTFGFTLSAYQVYGSPGHIKGALEKSGIYDSFISDVLESAEKEQAPGGTDDIPADQAGVQQVIEQAASPEFLRAQAEGFLDGLYAWARGESDTLQFEINLTETKTKLADGLAQYAQTRAASLPACTAADVSLIQAGDFDVLNAQCVPPGTDIAAASEKIRQEIMGEEFLKDPVITADDIKNDQGQTLNQQLAGMSGLLNQIKTALWVSVVLIVLLSAAIVLLKRPWRAGLKRLGIVYVSVGGVITLLAYIGTVIISAGADALGKSGELQNSAAEIIRILVGDFRVWWLGYGLILLLLCVGMLVALRFIQAKEPEEPKNTAEGAEKPTPGEHEPKQPHTKTVQ